MALNMTHTLICQNESCKALFTTKSRHLAGVLFCPKCRTARRLQRGKEYRAKRKLNKDAPAHYVWVVCLCGDRFKGSSTRAVLCPPCKATHAKDSHRQFSSSSREINRAPAPVVTRRHVNLKHLQHTTGGRLTDMINGIINGSVAYYGRGGGS